MINITKRFEKGLAYRQAGFTLIEVLIVLAILAVLLGAVISVLDPVDQLARTRDTARLSAVSDLGKAVQGHYVARGGKYPPIGTAAEAQAWISSMKAYGDIKVVPADIAPVDSNTICAAAAIDHGKENGFCLDKVGSGINQQVIIYTPLESKNMNNKCKVNDATKPIAWAAWDSGRQNACITCTAALTTSPAPAVASNGTVTATTCVN